MSKPKINLKEEIEKNEMEKRKKIEKWVKVIIRSLKKKRVENMCDCKLCEMCANSIQTRIKRCQYKHE